MWVQFVLFIKSLYANIIMGTAGNQIVYLCLPVYCENYIYFSLY